MTQTATTSYKNLSHINNAATLYAEIHKTKAAIKLQEVDLQQRWKQLPQETFKATAGAVLPTFLNNFIASKTFGLVKGAGGLLLGSSLGKGNIKEQLLSNAKQLGLFTALRAVLGLWKKKK